MILRRATSKDLEAVFRMHSRSITAACKGYYSDEQIASWTGVLAPEIYESALHEKVFLVAQCGKGRIHGMGILDCENCEVSAVYICPESLGKHVGSGILQELENIAKDSNISMLTVHSTLNAKEFYKRKGYAEKKSMYHELPNGLRLECIEMVKEFRKSQDALAG